MHQHRPGHRYWQWKAEKVDPQGLVATYRRLRARQTDQRVEKER